MRMPASWLVAVLGLVAAWLSEPAWIFQEERVCGPSSMHDYAGGFLRGARSSWPDWSGHS